VGIIWDKALEQQINLGDEILKIDDLDNDTELTLLLIDTGTHSDLFG